MAAEFTSDDMARKRFSWSNSRILAALAVSAGVFTAARPRGGVQFIQVMAVAVSLGGIVLMARKDTAWPIMRCVLWCIGGMLFSGLFFYPLIVPGYNDGDEYLLMIAGVICGYMMNMVVTVLWSTHSRRRDSVFSTLDTGECGSQWTWARFGVRSCPLTGIPTPHEHDPREILEGLRLLQCSGGQVRFYDAIGRAVVILDVPAPGASPEYVRNAGRFSGWSVDVCTAATFSRVHERALREFKSVDGISPELARSLVDAGYTCCADVSASDVEMVMQLGALDRETAMKIIERAERSLEASSAEPTS